MRITLAWTDAPGALGADPAPVNDLDLQADTVEEIYRGNVFERGHTAAGRSFNRRTTSRT